MRKNKNCAVRLTDNGLAFEGIIDHQSIPALMARIPELSAGTPVLDLSAVSRIDSAGLAFLIHWSKRLAQPEQKIALTGVSAQARQLIDTMKLDSVFEVHNADVLPDNNSDKTEQIAASTPES